MLKVLQHWNGISLPTILILICCKPMFHSAQHRFMYTHYSLTRRANWWQMVALNGLILPLQWTSYMESRTPLQSTKGNLWIHAFLGGGGGVGLVCAPRRVAKCVLYACIGGGGGQKRPKNCVYTFSMPPWEYSSAWLWLQDAPCWK